MEIIISIIIIVIIGMSISHHHFPVLSTYSVPGPLHTLSHLTIGRTSGDYYCLILEETWKPKVGIIISIYVL